MGVEEKEFFKKLMCLEMNIRPHFMVKDLNEFENFENFEFVP